MFSLILIFTVDWDTLAHGAHGGVTSQIIHGDNEAQLKQRGWAIEEAMRRQGIGCAWTVQ